MKRVFKALFENFHYKLIAFVFAVLLWLLAAKKEIVSSEITARIYVKPPEKFHVIAYKPKYIHIFVEGTRNDVSALKEEARAYIKLPEKLKEKKGFIKIKIEKGNILLPTRSVRIVAFSPKTIDVKVERLIKKVVPVKLEAYGIREGYRLILSPNYVTIHIPESEKGKVRFVRTEKVDISSIKGNAELYLNVETAYKPNPKRVKLIIRRMDEGT